MIPVTLDEFVDGLEPVRDLSKLQSIEIGDYLVSSHTDPKDWQREGDVILAYRLNPSEARFFPSDSPVAFHPNSGVKIFARYTPQGLHGFTERVLGLIVINEQDIKKGIFYLARKETPAAKAIDSVEKTQTPH